MRISDWSSDVCSSDLLGKIIKDKYPELDEEDQEAVRQHAIAALNLTQQAKKIALGGDGSGDEPSVNTALIDGVREFALAVRELDITSKERRVGKECVRT